ncbi:MAG: FapA family protein [Phycisphaerae bacterium]
MSTIVENALNTYIDEDRLRAYIQPARGVDPRSIQVKTIAMALGAAKIEINDHVKGRIRAFVDRTSAGRGRMEKFLIAEGRLPVEARDGGVRWSDSIAGAGSQDEPPGDTPFGEGDAESRIRLSGIIVERDAAIGRLIPPKPGQSGVNVHGHPLAPSKGQGDPIELGESVSLAEDSVTLIANRKGRVVSEDGRISIHELLEIDRDIKPNTHKTDWHSDVIIHGVVGHGATIASERSIIVTGTIRSAEVKAGESIIVHYGVTGQGKGNLHAGRDVIAKFCEEANIVAGRDILIGKNVVNSHLCAGGRVLAGRAPIIGGEVRARHSVEALALGSDNGIETCIGVGVSMEVIKRAGELEEANRSRREQLEALQAALVPLQANLKRLDSTQKERATELGFQVSALETEIAEAETQRRNLLAEVNDGAFIHVVSTLHEGVRLTIGDRTMLVNRVLTGPVRIERRKIRNVTEMVAVYGGDRGVAVLKSKRIG